MSETEQQADFDTLDDDVESSSTLNGYDCNKMKMSVFLFIMFILLNSDVFVDRVLADKSGKYAVGRQVTSQGMYVQAILMALSFIVLDILMNNNYI